MILGLVQRKVFIPAVAKPMGIDVTEAAHMFAIASSDFVTEMVIEGIGDSAPIVGGLTELLEWGLDIKICFVIWQQYHKKQGFGSFIKHVTTHRPPSFMKAAAFYLGLSAIKIAIKTFPVLGISHVGGFALNSTQTIILILLWTKYCQTGGTYEPFSYA